MPHQLQSTGQIGCEGCHRTLAYPIGALSVRCPMCSTVTTVYQFSVTCVCCRCVLILPQNTSLEMCPRCRTVMLIPASIREGGADPRIPPRQCVYIDKPPTIDASGRKVTHLAVGPKIDSDATKDAA
ncbi:unnamed protein product [Phytomonas sp. EM1]|nr:unnamed protein product [Phytomonas sp. EM1]|eukprot:CCW65161.1 unnamed protein product [Phytomonas sp. isolate EM1]